MYLNGRTTQHQPAVGVFRLQLFGGSETFIINQANHFRRYSPIFVGREIAGHPPDLCDFTCCRPGVDVLRTKVFRAPGPFVRALSGRRLALIHAHFAIDAVYAVPLSAKLNIPLVTTLHGFDVTTHDSVLLRSRRAGWINGVIYRRQLQRRGSLFLCVSDFIRTAALSKGFPPERTIVHPIGIDLERFSSLRNSPVQSGLIVHVARLVEKKGTRYLLSALAELIPHRANAQLVVIGDGPLRTDLEAQSRSLGLSDRVTFLGQQPNEEVMKWIARSEIVAVPSITAPTGDSEGLPTVIFEAGAMQRAVVASRTSGIPEAITDEETGLLSDEGNAKQLAHNLFRVLSNSDLRVSLGRNARAKMENSFDIRKQTGRLEALYDQAISQFPRVDYSK